MEQKEFMILMMNLKNKQSSFSVTKTGDQREENWQQRT